MVSPELARLDQAAAFAPGRAAGMGPGKTDRAIRLGPGERPRALFFTCLSGDGSRVRGYLHLPTTRALFFTCLSGDRPRRPGGLLDQAGAAELAAVEALERGRAFPYSIPCPMGMRRG